MSCSAPVVSTGRAQLASESRGGGLCAPSCQNDSLKVLQVLKRQRLNSRIFSGGHESYRKCSKNIVANGLPMEAISGAAAVVIVTGSVGALLWMNKSKDVVAEKPKCDACNGSGLCSACNGEGFQLKSLSPEAAARARANARDAATRYTAGLAKKWNYCTACTGSRNCPECGGSGIVITRTGR